MLNTDDTQNAKSKQMHKN